MPLLQFLHTTLIENPRHIIRRFTPAARPSSTTRYLDENPAQKPAAEMRFIGMSCAVKANDIYTKKVKPDPGRPAHWFDLHARRGESAYQRLINLDKDEAAFRLKQSGHQAVKPYNALYSICRDVVNNSRFFKQIKPEMFFSDGRMWLVGQKDIKPTDLEK